MTSKVTDKGGGSKGHNSIEKYNYYVNGVDENIVLSTLVNNIEVTPSNGMGDKQLHELSGISGFENEVLYNVKNLGESCKDMYITSGADMHDTCSHTVNTLNNIAINRATQLSDQNHLMTTCMETTTAKSQISINVKPDLVQLPNYYHVSLFHVISHDVARNADIWYCYIHGYPLGSVGGFYLLDISNNDGQIRIFQCDVQHIAPLHVKGTLFLCIQPVVMVHQYLHQELLDARRTYDNYKHDQFIQYTCGVSYQSYMDQLIGSIIKFQDNFHCDATSDSCGLSQHINNDTESIIMASTMHTRYC